MIKFKEITHSMYSNLNAQSNASTQLVGSTNNLGIRSCHQTYSFADDPSERLTNAYWSNPWGFVYCN